MAKASTMPDFVMTASGQRFSAALVNKLKSSCVIFTLTWTVVFMLHVSATSRFDNNDTLDTI